MSGAAQNGERVQMLILRTPAFLLLLIPLVALAIVAGRDLGGRRASGRRQAAALALRCAGFLLLILALAQPVAPATARPLPAAFVADTSASISATARKDEEAWLHAALQQGGSAAGSMLVSLDGQPTLTALPASAGEDWLRRRLAPGPAANATDIAGALRLALGAVPNGSQIVLLSDGLQTTGDARAAAAEAAARHVAIDPVLLPGAQDPDAAVTRLVAQGTAHGGDTIALQITVWSNRSANAVLKVSQDGRPVGQQAVQLGPGENPLLVSLPAPASGWHSFHAAIAMPGDTVPQNDALDTVSLVTATPRLLVVAQDATGSAITPLLRALGFQVVPVTPGRFPQSSSGIGVYDAVLLDDLPAAALGARQVKALDDAVRAQGIGLFVLGGPHSLTLGHYSQTPLEHMLPVLSDTPNSLQESNVALQLVMDRSGSMDDLAGDVPKIEMARSAASIALDFAVQHKDDMGLVSFDIVPHTLFPMQRVGPANAARVHGIIGGMTADGGTDIYAALRTGLGQILRSAAPYKHIILMTDGRSEPGGYNVLLDQLQRDHITLSAIGLGADADVGLLHYLAARGKGRFYYTNNARDLPHIFAEEARLSAGSARVTGTIGVALGTSSPVTRSLISAVPPPIHGYTATVLKREGQADLLSRSTGSTGDPLLAQWQYGLGRVLVWTPGSATSWAGDWVKAQPTFWNDALRWVLHGAHSGALTPALLPGEGPRRIQVDTLQNAGTYLDLLRLDSRVQLPDGQSRPVTFEQTGPGRYEATVPDAGPGIYRLSIAASQGAAPAESLLAVPYAREYLPRAPDTALLSQLAAITGGRVLTDPREALGPSRQSSEAGSEYWWALAAGALVLLLADMAIRLSDWGFSADTGPSRGDAPATAAK